MHFYLHYYLATASYVLLLSRFSITNSLGDVSNWTYPIRGCIAEKQLKYLERRIQRRLVNPHFLSYHTIRKVSNSGLIFMNSPSMIPCTYVSRTRTCSPLSVLLSKNGTGPP